MLDSSFATQEQARAALRLHLEGWQPPLTLSQPPELHLRGFWTDMRAARSNQGLWFLQEIPRFLLYQERAPDGEGVRTGTPWRLRTPGLQWKEWRARHALPQTFPSRRRALDHLSMALGLEPHQAVWGLIELPPLR